MPIDTVVYLLLAMWFDNVVKRPGTIFLQSTKFNESIAYFQGNYHFCFVQVDFPHLKIVSYIFSKLAIGGQRYLRSRSIYLKG